MHAHDSVTAAIFPAPHSACGHHIPYSPTTLRGCVTAPTGTSQFTIPTGTEQCRHPFDAHWNTRNPMPVFAYYCVLYVLSALLRCIHTTNTSAPWPTHTYFNQQLNYDHLGYRKGWFSNTTFTTGLKTLPYLALVFFRAKIFALKKTRASGRNVGKVFNPVVKLVLENQPFLMPEPAENPSLHSYLGYRLHCSTCCWLRE